MEERVHLLLLLLLALSCFSCINHISLAQVTIPAKIDGFVYEGFLPQKKSIVVEAFFDPVCPDSRAAWFPLKQAIKHYSPLISLTVHTFALPYHDNAFVTSRVLHIANKLNPTTTYPLLDLLFKHQEKYYNKATHEMSRASIIEDIAKLAVKATGNNSLSEFKSGFQDSQTDKATRISFKYGCSRGVTGTPYFFINGFPLLDDGSPLDYNKWRLVFDPLVQKQ